MDVQCGPDTLAAYPMLSASTSLIRSPPVFSTGIKILDGVTDTHVQRVDFGTTTLDNGIDKIITPRSRSIGIKIKDSGVNIANTFETFTMTQELAKFQSQSPTRENTKYPMSWSPASRNCSPERNTMIPDNGIDIKGTVKTELIKPVSSPMKTADSGSEYCMSFSSYPKDTPPLASLSKNTSEVLLSNSTEYKEGKEIEKFSNLKYSKPKLCCGGIHVHSFKDRQVSEDIIYQGEWQRYRAKSCRKKIHSTILAKKINESACRKQKDAAKDKKVNQKEKIPFKKIDKTDSKVVPRKPLQAHSPRLPKSKPEDTRNESHKLSLPKPNIIPNINKNRPPKSLTNVSKVIILIFLE